MDALAQLVASWLAKLNAALGRSQADQARAQQSEMDKMNAAIQAAKERKQ